MGDLPRRARARRNARRRGDRSRSPGRTGDRGRARARRSHPPVADPALPFAHERRGSDGTVDDASTGAHNAPQIDGDGGHMALCPTVVRSGARSLRGDAACGQQPDVHRCRLLGTFRSRLEHPRDGRRAAASPARRHLQRAHHGPGPRAADGVGTSIDVEERGAVRSRPQRVAVRGNSTLGIVLTRSLMSPPSDQALTYR